MEPRLRPPHQGSPPPESDLDSTDQLPVLDPKAYEAAARDRVADTSVLPGLSLKEPAPQPQPGPDPEPDLRLELAEELGGRFGVARTNASDQPSERFAELGRASSSRSGEFRQPS